ncbi:hypothetical protein [uncultured Selenomonas sp.]|uniref:hypothetical protein n=1 Tax=uncultured Selenomonas sp. TaxID=159275 RepID=UPI002590DADE|nr:hypothetical protein [uncultured Selenomonas sp.]
MDETSKTSRYQFFLNGEDKPSTDFTEENFHQLADVLRDFYDSYAQKGSNVSDTEWLTQKLQKELPDYTPEQLHEFVQGIGEGVSTFEKNLSSITESAKLGKDSYVWFADQLEKLPVHQDINQYGNYLTNIEHHFETANIAMMDTIRNQDGSINMNPNLDGFIAEQKIVNSFNNQAVLQNSRYRATVLKPEGTTYGKNSVDIGIKDITGDGHLVRRYQVKFGADAKHTASYLEHGDYRGQRSLVPKGQAEKVRTLVSKGKQVTEIIESPDGKVKSEPISKEEVQELRNRVQNGRQMPKEGWNSYNTRELAVHIGQHAILAGIQSAAMGAGQSFLIRALNGQEIKGSDIAKDAIRSGAPKGIQMATSAAIKVAAARGYVQPLAALNTMSKVEGIIFGQIGAYAMNIAASMFQAAMADMSLSEALNHIIKSTVAMHYGLIGETVGGAIGAAALSFIPVIGTAVGYLVGSAIGYVAGSGIGKTIYNGIKKVAHAAKKVVSTVYHAVVKVVDTVTDVFRNVVGGITGFVSSLFD